LTSVTTTMPDRSTAKHPDLVVLRQVVGVEVEVLEIGVGIVAAVGLGHLEGRPGAGGARQDPE
jgi:hypothetical protein